MDKNLFFALEDSLNRIVVKDRAIKECLHDYPLYKSELEPLLWTAKKLKVNENN